MSKMDHVNNGDMEIVVKAKSNDACPNNNNGMFFIDGFRRIDFVLVYQRFNDSNVNKLKREGFLNTLIKEGLQIEIQDDSGHEHSIDGLASADVSLQNTPRKANIEEDKCSHCNLVFIKIHATWTTLSRYAEIMKIRKPMLNLGIEYDFNRKTFLQRIFEKFDFLNIFNINETRLNPIKRGFTWPYSTAKEYLFDIPDDRSSLFTSSERSLIVNYILRRASYRRISEKKKFDVTDLDALEADIEMNSMDHSCTKIVNDSVEHTEVMTAQDRMDNAKGGMDYGIAKLLNEGVFESAYPLHEGDADGGTDTQRNLLHQNWVKTSNIFRLQPLDHIRLYYGEKVAFYFAWLGYYTYWLLPISILGIIVTILNLVMAADDEIVREVCSSNTTMCPLICTGRGCKFWKLSDACSRFFVIRVLDTGATVFLAIVMSIWASLFLEMWKRQQNRLAYHWNVHDMEYEDEPPRPEFIALIDRNYPSKVNRISGKEEPYIPFWSRRVPVTIFTYSTVLLSIMMALAFLVGIIIYKLVTGYVLRMMTINVVSNMSGIITAATGSMISLITIMSLTLVYSRVAVWLTDVENHRTQSQYDSSVTLKLYLLEFINNYSSVFYIGFIQPYTQPPPGVHTNSVIRPTGCPAGGCLVELSLQLAFIMIGKQIISHIKEYAIPRLCSTLKAYKLQQAENKIALRNSGNNDDALKIEMDVVNDKDAPEISIAKEGDVHKEIRLVNPELVRCYADNLLADPGPRPLFGEYIEMLIQFGFMTIFIPAFPLAPLLALINNLLEIRSDALKFVRALRRPVAQRTMNIGIWFPILVVVTQIAVKSNAILIAFATSYIERFVYKFINSNNVDTYVKFSMSKMNSSEFSSSYYGVRNSYLGTNETYCSYQGFRYPPDDFTHEPYSLSRTYWQILALKVLFVYLFENIVYLFMALIAFMVPDVPARLRIAMKREAVLTNEIILKAELLRNKNANASKIVADSFKKSADLKKMMRQVKCPVIPPNEINKN